MSGRQQQTDLSDNVHHEAYSRFNGGVYYDKGKIQFQTALSAVSFESTNFSISEKIPVRQSLVIFDCCQTSQNIDSLRDSYWV